MKTRHTEKKTAGSQRTAAGGQREMREEIIDWLRDAYAMERGLESALKKQADNDDLSATTRSRAAAHLEETRHHADDVRAALQSLDADTSAVKTGIGMTMQATKGMATMLARDERVKDLLDGYAMEHLEIACYTALAAAAERAGLSQVAETCRRIIPDEERMARAILEFLPTEVGAYLFESAAADR